MVTRDRGLLISIFFQIRHAPRGAPIRSPWYRGESGPGLVGGIWREFVLFSGDLLLMELTHKVLLNFLFTVELIYFIFAHVIFDIISWRMRIGKCQML